DGTTLLHGRRAPKSGARTGSRLRIGAPIGDQSIGPLGSRCHASTYSGEGGQSPRGCVFRVLARFAILCCSSCSSETPLMTCQLARSIARKLAASIVLGTLALASLSSPTSRAQGADAGSPASTAAAQDTSTPTAPAQTTPIEEN